MVSFPGFPGSGRLGPHHGLRMLLIWLVLFAPGGPLIWFLLGQILPPGHMASAAESQRLDNTVLTVTAAAVAVAVYGMFGYALYHWRYRGGPVVDGPHLRGDNRITTVWIAVSVALVVILAGWGSWELFPGENGAGGGQGAHPLSIAMPADASSALQLQVIGQQWMWTFRYPQYGNVETTKPVLPVGREIEFHITSLDVIHSFSAIQLGVKGDAVPGVDNIAFSKPFQTGPFIVRCYELCGIWHGHMFVTGRVVSQAAFARWIAHERTANAPATKQLPHPSRVYYPQPLRRAT